MSLNILVTALLLAAQLARPLSPLAALTAAELSATVALLRADGKATESARFALIALQEPDKATLRASEPPHRIAEVLLHDRADGRTFSGAVDLTAQRVVRWTAQPGAQPPLLGADYQQAVAIAAADPDWQQALAKRRLRHDDLEINTWGAGTVAGVTPGTRLVRLVPYLKAGGPNFHARPIEGLTALVDLTAGRIARLIDTGTVPIPPAEPIRSDAAPPAAVAAAPSEEPFVVGRDGQVRWRSWRFRFGLHPREGLVLRQVGWADDDGTVRPLVHRASLAEMAVPYGDPSEHWRWRCAFDEGEYQLGAFTSALTRGAEVPAGARLFEAVLADELGAPYTLPRAIGLYERDGGILWKHNATVRRARQLVLVWYTTVGNYDYGFTWLFGEDGSLTMDVALTGVVQVKGVDPILPHDSETTGSTHRIDASRAAVDHQHFFCFRLDLDIDGPANRLVEVNGVPLDGGGFGHRETTLSTEQAARRRAQPETGRFWKVVNDGVAGPAGGPTGYALVPQATAAPVAAADTAWRQRAAFADQTLWATPYAPEERYPAGEFVNQSGGGDGLPAWTRADRPLSSRDIVLWHTVGVTHLPRPEDWPVMPAHHAGFTLLPVGFFGRNPTASPVPGSPPPPPPRRAGSPGGGSPRSGSSG
jgi:primary-amine oxidase